MTTKAIAGNWNVPTANGRAGGVGDGALSLLLGVGVTFGLFAGIAYYERTAPRNPPTEFSDLGIAVLPVEPPPPPTHQTEAVPDIALVPGLELSASDSAVKLAVSPINLELLRPEDLSRTPAASIELRLPPSFRPRADLRADAQHVYQRIEVDTPATMLNRTVPQVSRRIMEDASALHSTYLWIIETDGSVTNVRLKKSSGNPKVDALMFDMVKESVWSPALKAGKKVREMTEQTIDIKWSEGSIFH